MKKYVMIFLISLLTILNPKVTHAACDYETQIKIRQEAVNVQANYEAGWFGTGEYEESEVDDEEYESIDPGVVVNIYNITKNIYITVENKATSEINTYYYEDTDNGSISWQRDDVENIVEYEIKVYSNVSDCQDEELHKINLVTPKYNDYSNLYFCMGIKEYYCQEFVTQDILLNENEMQEKYEEYLETLPMEEIPPEKEESFLKKYGIYILGGVIGIVFITVLIIFIRRKRNRIVWKRDILWLQ